MPKLPVSENRNIANLYEAGFSIREVAKIMNSDYSTIRKRLISLGIELRGRGGGPGRQIPNDVIQRYKYYVQFEGIPIAEIVRREGSNRSTVSKRLELTGIDTSRIKRPYRKKAAA